MGFCNYNLVANKEFMKPKIIGCDYCGELKPSTGGSKQVSNGQFQKIFLCDDWRELLPCPQHHATLRTYDHREEFAWLPVCRQVIRESSKSLLGLG